MITRRAAALTAMRPVTFSRPGLQHGAEDLQRAAALGGGVERRHQRAPGGEAGQHRHRRDGRLVHVQHVESPARSQRSVRARVSGPKASRATQPL